MTRHSQKMTRGLLMLSVASVFVLSPATHFALGPDGIHMAGGHALAKDGSDDSGSGSSGSGGGDDGGSDDSGSGSSGSGSGGDDGRDDSRSGEREDDDRGRDRGRDRGSEKRGRERESKSRSESAEIQGSHIEVRYANGFKDEIENGIFERKDPSGVTVSRRPATDADRARLTGAANRISRSLSRERDRAARTIHAEIAGDNIEIRYSDGWKEEIEAGRYELKDPNNNTVIQRRARQSDIIRLRQLAGQ